MATRKSTKKFTIGGVAVTAAQIIEAIQILTEAKGIMVAQPLRKAENPLANCDYHGTAHDQRELDGDATSLTKVAFIHALERSIAG
jgi:hypothetical protein